MKYYQTIKAYECISGAKSNHGGRLVKGNVEIVRTIYDEHGAGVKTQTRVFERKDDMYKELPTQGSLDE